MFGFHYWELLIILLIVILLFGARRLPQLGSAIGQTYKQLQKGLKNSDEPTEDGVIESEPSTPTEARRE